MASYLQTVGPGKAAMQFENLRAYDQIPGYVWSTTNQEWHRSAQADGSSLTFLLTFCSVLFCSVLQKVDDAHKHWGGADTLLSLLLR